MKLSNRKTQILLALIPVIGGLLAAYWQLVYNPAQNNVGQERTMVIKILSIDYAAGPPQRTANYGRYKVVIEANGIPHDFIYTCELSDKMQSVTWEPKDSILSDSDAVDVLVVASINDRMWEFHRGEPVQLPLVVSPKPVGPDTTVIRLQKRWWQFWK